MLKKIIIVLILLSFYTITAGESDKPNYFPLHIGDKWIYEHTELPKEVTTRFNIIEIVDTVKINNKKYYYSSEITGSYWGYSLKSFSYWHLDSLKQLWGYNSRTNKEQIILGFNYPLGQTIILQIGSSTTFTHTITLMDTNETIYTPAGKFSHCYFFQTEIVEIHTDFRNWYAPNIGKVLVESEGEGLILYGANINGIVIGDTSINIPNNIARAPNKIATDIQLDQNYPNPFNNETTICWSINTEKPVPVKLIIYNIKGEEIKTLINSNLYSGFYQEQWDGRDIWGTIVPSGIYYYSIISEQKKIFKKLLLLK